MMGKSHLVALVVVALALPLQASADCVVLLHGLARTSKSMTKLASAFDARGYTVANVDYPSRKKPIEELAVIAVEKGVDKCAANASEKIHFVTHSLGGIIVRYYLTHNQLSRLGRVVMLAPPNQGSEVVDNMGNFPGFYLLNGPAGSQLGTGEGGIPLTLGPVTYPVGVVAGTRTINLLLSQYLPNPDDGKVSVENTKVEGMADFIEFPVSHPFIMRRDAVIEQALAFIATGKFTQ
ncbi:MAG: esterase/lipase family protein [Pseudomonadales bacterium]